MKPGGGGEVVHLHKQEQIKHSSRNRNYMDLEKYIWHTEMNKNKTRMSKSLRDDQLIPNCGCLQSTI